MIADIGFYRVTYSPSRLLYPVMSPEATGLPGSLLVHVAENVKCSKDLSQTIHVPEFDDYDTVSMVAIDGEYYGITGYRISTLYKGQIEFNIEYEPVTSILRLDQDVVGLFDRTPEKESAWMQEDTISSALKEVDVDRLQNIENDTTVAFWVEITTTCELSSSASSSYVRVPDLSVQSQAEHHVVDNSTMYKYGFLTFYNTSGRSGSLYAQAASSTFEDWSGTVYANDCIAYYPSLFDIISNPDQSLGIPTDAILDISVASWCPYKFVYGTILAGSYTTGKNTSVSFGSDRQAIYLTLNDAEVRPDVIVAGAEDGFFYAMYDLGPVGFRKYPFDDWETHTFEITPMQKALGKAAIRDASGAVIAEIPMQYFIENEQGKPVLTYKAREYSDSTGLYFQIDLGDEVEHIITVPEGKLPYIGDSWQTYKIREMAQDRQALQDTKDQAWQSFAISLADSAVSGAQVFALGRVGAASEATRMSRNAAAVGAGVGTAIGGLLSTMQTIDAAEREQRLKEASVKAQPGTGYNTGYGLGYCENVIEVGAGIVLLMPVGIDEYDYRTYTFMMGYPAQGLRNVTLTAGFLRGQLFMVEQQLTPQNGPKMEMLVSRIAAGIRIIDPQ